MSGITDLTADVAQLTTVIGQAVTILPQLVQAISTLQATIAAGGDNDAAVEAQAQQVATLTSQLQTALSAVPASALPSTSTPPTPAAPPTPAS